MDKNPSETAGKAGGAKKLDQTSAIPEAAGVRRLVNARMVQNVLLIWLDASIDEENSADCRHTVTQLRRVVNTIDTFTDGEECIKFIENKSNEKACMIISGLLGKHIVPRVHNMSQVDSIFIFCGNKKHHEEWVKVWSKIKGVFTDIRSICEALNKATKECEHNAIPMSFVATTDDMSNKKLEQLDNSFMYTQIMKEILLTIKFEGKHIKEFLEYCQEQFVGNDKELQNINKFEQKYRQETPIWWYTYECFLYPMLNRALRLMEVDTIIKMGFFIGDLHRHIQALHSEQVSEHHSSSSFTVYRGQGMLQEAFAQMQQTKGGLMSFNSFLSTSKVIDVSLDFARRATTNPDAVGVLFVMTIDPSTSTTPFASVIDVSYFQGENEVLFSMHTIFRIRNIKPMDGNHRLFQVDLILTRDNDEDLRVLADHIRKETFPNSEGWYRLGELLRKMGQFEKAHQVFETILEQTTDESGKTLVYNQLGQTKHDQGDYKDAIALYEKTLQIYRKTLPSNHSDLAHSYNNIGNAYNRIGDYSKALLSHEKALSIRQQSLPPNHSDSAMSYNNIANAYYGSGDYSKALLSHEKALAIRQQSLPPNHPDLAMSYNNIGNVYNRIGQYSKALSFLEKALTIREQSLPPNHPEIAATYNNIGNAYTNMSNYSKALLSHEKALAIQEQSLSSNHPDLASTYSNIGNAYMSMDDYSKALLSHEKALEIQQQSLPPNHSRFANTYNRIGLDYESMSNYSNARSFYERAVNIAQRSLSSNHPDLQWYRKNLDRIKKKL